MFITPFFEGFVMSAGLIVAIGAQNAFVLKQGLKKQHLLLTAITCFICDSLLIILGVEGLGALITDIPWLGNVMRWGGAIFLIGYGIRSFIHVFKPTVLITETDSPSKNDRLSTLLALLGFTFLNPHTYVDTMLLLGGIGAQYPLPEHMPFIIGASFASLVWFFGLTYGASILSPVFKKPLAWQILNTLMGFGMIGIALSLIF